MKTKPITNELFNEIVFHLGQEIRDNVDRAFPYAEVVIKDTKAVFRYNIISVDFGTIGNTKLGFKVHMEDLPEMQREYIRASIAIWFIDVDEGFLVSHEGIEA